MEVGDTVGPVLYELCLILVHVRLLFSCNYHTFLPRLAI